MTPSAIASLTLMEADGLRRRAEAGDHLALRDFFLYAAWQQIGRGHGTHRSKLEALRWFSGRLGSIRMKVAKPSDRPGETILPPAGDQSEAGSEPARPS